MGARKKSVLFPCEMCGQPKVKNPEADNVCPECDALMRAAEAEVRVMKLPAGPVRLCRLCKCQLESNRYFACETCIPDLPSEESPALEQFERISYFEVKEITKRDSSKEEDEAEEAV